LHIVQLSLRDGRAALRAPDRRRLLPIDTAIVEEPKERELRGQARAVVNGAIGVAPVHREAEELPEGIIVPLGLLAYVEAATNEGTAADLLGCLPLALLH